MAYLFPPAVARSDRKVWRPSYLYLAEDFDMLMTMMLVCILRVFYHMQVRSQLLRTSSEIVCTSILKYFCVAVQQRLAVLATFATNRPTAGRLSWSPLQPSCLLLY